jgi:hypothetical protein
MSMRQHSEKTIKALVHRLEDSFDVAIHVQLKGSLSTQIYHCSAEEKDWMIMALRFACTAQEWEK